MDNHILGIFYEAGSSRSIEAYANEQSDGSIEIYHADSDSLVHSAVRSGIRFGQIIPGVAVELSFENGALFQPSDKNFRWHSIGGNEQLLANLEKSKLAALLAIVFIPVFLWWVITIGAPGAAERVVVLLPDFVKEQASQQTLTILDKAAFSDSEISTERQAAVAKLWSDTLIKLDLPPEEFHLNFRKSDTFGANAFALPDGSVVVTDDLLKLLEHNDTALLAILLHEIGHVEHQHGMKMVARSVATSMVFTFIFGEVEGAGEIIVGASSSLIDSAFSRDMETEADQYAFDKLKQLGHTSEPFARAMEALASAHNTEDDNTPLKYFNSHPDIEARILEARKQAQ